MPGQLLGTLMLCTEGGGQLWGEGDQIGVCLEGRSTDNDPAGEAPFPVLRYRPVDRDLPNDVVVILRLVVVNVPGSVREPGGNPAK